MIEKTTHIKGKNNFKENTFIAQEWSAPIMISPEEIKALISSYNLEGRVIKRMRIIGLAYNLTRDWVEERAYNYYKGLDEKERQEKSEYACISSEVSYSRYVEIDEPFLIEFEDGDIFEIDTPQVPEFRMSMNCIPWEIKAGTNMPNVEADLLFSTCIGRTIKTVEVETYITDEDPMYREPFDEQKSKRCLVSGITLRFEDGTGLRFEGWIDFCHVVFVDKESHADLITFKELKPALFNPEDLHTDAVTGYEADSYVFNFGELGASHTEIPYITLIPSGKDSRLYITVEDFLLFDWSITIYTKASFDEYGEYEFSFQQWNAVLQIAKKIISFTSFDELFEYMKGFGITSRRLIGGTEYNVMLNSINHFGAEFWKHLDRYRTQYKDMIGWTKVALSENETLTIMGF